MGGKHMTWDATLSIVALLFAVGKFIDTYHNKSRISQRAILRARDFLVRMYFFLSDVKPSRIAKPAIRIVLKIRYLFYIALVLTMLFAWKAFTGFALVFGNVSIPLDWSFVLISIGLLVLFLVFTVLRMCVARLSDGVTSLVVSILAPLFLYWGLEVIGAVAGVIPNLAGFYFGLAAVATYLVVCVPIAVLLVMFVVIIASKYLTLLLRWFGLHISEAASDPGNNPFTYFSVLLTVLVLAYKTLLEVFW